MEKIKGFTLRLEPDLLKAVEKIADSEKRSKNFVVSDLLEKQLKTQELL